MNELETFQWEEGTIKKYDDFWLVIPHVRLDITYTERFFNKVNDVINLNLMHVIIDMQYVPYVSSTGIKSILSLKKFLSMRGYKICLINLSDVLKKIIVISEIENLIPIFLTFGEAVEYIKTK